MALPAMGSSELNDLALALESMRLKLDGKAYIEQYVHTLTHELKARWPLSPGRLSYCESLHRQRPHNVF